MVISKNSQLGLRFADQDVKVDFLQIMKSFIVTRLSSFNEALRLAENVDSFMEKTGKQEVSADELNDLQKSLREKYNECIELTETKQELIDKIGQAVNYSDLGFVSDAGTKYFFICESVYRAAELIRIGEGFTSRTLKDINFGSYTYLMGKNRMVRFICGRGAIKGFYYSDKERNAFEFGLDIETGEYYAPKDCAKEFSMIMQVMAFVELGDIEVITLDAGRNNGKAKQDGKITNTANNTVYVVDSTWNQMIIRTTGFAVRGHFRLQPCGVAMLDRKLMWINAFEKHGYKRRPKAEIVH